MGENKALLEVGGAAMLRRAAETLGRLVDDLFLVADDPLPYAGLGVRVLPDVRRGRGALGGIHAALSHAAHPFVLCAACDMPFIAPALAALMLESAVLPCDAVIARLPQGPEPLLAVYSRSLLPAIEASLAAGRLRVVDALADARVRWLEAAEIDRVDPGRRSFVNVNTPAELAEARAAAGGREGAP